jgi:hypothetical protein
MAQISSPRRITVEDYPEEVQPAMQILADSINNFMDEVSSAFSGDIGTENLRRQITSVTLTGTATGRMTNLKVGTGLSSIVGINVINVENLSNSNALLVSAPFVLYTNLGGGTMQIQQVTGLVTGNQYRLTLEIIG